jgi:hypothetical protein
VDFELVPKSREPSFERAPSRRAEDVADEEDPQLGVF